MGRWKQHGPLVAVAALSILAISSACSASHAPAPRAGSADPAVATDAEPAPSTPDAAVDRDTGSAPGTADAAHAPAARCVQSEATARVEGTTPDGEIRFEYAWVAFHSCREHQYADLFLSTDPGIPSLEPTSGRNVWIPIDPLREGTRTAGIYMDGSDGELYSASGQLEIERVDIGDAATPGLLHGRYDVSGDGWDLHATFEAEGCVLAYTECPF